MNLLVLSTIKHDGTVYEKGSTILNISKKDAKRLIDLNVAKEVETGFPNGFDEDDEKENLEKGDSLKGTSEDNLKQIQKKKSDKKTNEE